MSKQPSDEIDAADWEPPSASRQLYELARIYDLGNQILKPTQWERFKARVHALLFPDCEGSGW